MLDMPKSQFEAYRNHLDEWLRKNVDDVVLMPKTGVERYALEGITDGWSVSLPETSWRVHILIESTFPFRPAKIALAGVNRYLQWPHVEEEGILCLPENEYFPIECLDSSIRETLSSAQKLLDKCQSPEYIRSESSREFQNYWFRQSANESGGEVLSLLNLKNRENRRIYFNAPNTGCYWLVGESENQIKEWLINCGIKPGPTTHQANLLHIDSPPSLPLPSSGRQFVKELLDQGTDVNLMFAGIDPRMPTLIVLSIDTPDGIGLIGAEFPSYFRTGFQANPKPKAIKAQWMASQAPKLVRINRADSSWIHGRDQNPSHSRLVCAHVVALGAGSLGSQVISRLAEAGVGKISIIDPERMDTSNAGRHALGLDSYGRPKAKQLASRLSNKYPHSIFRGIPESFQSAIKDFPELFECADLIVCCIGDSSQELFWDEWRRTEVVKPPTVHGWLGTQGATGHALALGSEGPGLSCFLDVDGSVRQPDTSFKRGRPAKVIPGCGTEFQPYGPLAAGQVELLVSRLILDILSGTTSIPVHRVFACSDSDLKDVGGVWTDRHQQYRPEGYSGSFEYQPAIEYCRKCHSCLMH